MDGNRIATILYLLLCVLMSFIQKGLGLECYMCNSHKLKNCENIKALNETIRVDYAVNCEQLKHAAERNYTQCRKIVQNVDGDRRVIRQCAGFGPDENSCISRTGTKLIKMQYCHCDESLCNSATYSYATSIPTVLASCVAMLYQTYI